LAAASDVAIVGVTAGVILAYWWAESEGPGINNH